ncbi:CCAAT/enhancer-binding protein alpha-like [Lytechinus variegatus]|uniref:CCAAT/enhancer-binding protein alpha-like n=1 Tax=Lytechinus variegatus TaxID=7654 RepID=UPI001BB1B6CC|nr:CCAAT/enhancer-binding protein alpha-like [Lytechinus variegatus]
MDSFSQIMSQCHLGTANEMMDSPANFYDCEAEEKRFTVKQEQFDEIEETQVGLGDLLHCENSIDLGVYLGRTDSIPQNQLETTGDGILRQLEEFASHQQQMLTQAPAPTPGAPAQPNQQSVHSVDHIHFETTISNMPQNTQAHIEQSVPDYQWINSNSTSAASSPGLPTDTFDEQSQDGHTPVLISSANSASGSGSSQNKRKRPVPTPGTEEYKLKRERNNIAVRKSREKTKVKNRELQDKVGDLQSENAALKKRVEGLTRELTVLRSLFINTGKAAPAALEKAVK